VAKYVTRYAVIAHYRRFKFFTWTQVFTDLKYTEANILAQAKSLEQHLTNVEVVIVMREYVTPGSVPHGGIPRAGIVRRSSGHIISDHVRDCDDGESTAHRSTDPIQSGAHDIVPSGAVR